MRRLASALGSVAVLVALLTAVPAGAAEDSYYYELWNGLMSPFCPGRSLMDCPSGQATELREWIQAQDEAGQSRDAVETALYERFGDAILQAPRAEGFGLAAYLVPMVAILFGTGVVATFLIRQRRRAQPAEPAAPGAAPVADPELERMLDTELGDAP